MRCDGKMSYKDFIFPVNPRTITIRTDRHVALSAVPGGSDVVSDLGSGARIVSGEGEFFGEGAVQSFLRLRQVMNSGGGGMLYIPSQSPIFAVAKSSGSGRLSPRLSALKRSSMAFFGSFLKFAHTCRAPIWAIPYSI